MFQKFGKDVPQSLVDAVSGIMSEAKADEPAAPDADAIARRKRLQAIKDKQEDDAAETSYKKDTSVRKVSGSAYGGAKQKDDIEEELKGNQHKIDKNKNGKIDADDFKKLRNEEEVNEVLTKKTPLKTWIKDFVHSKNSKFADKSKEERSKMAQGAFYGKQKEEVEQVVEYAGQPKDVPFDADKPHAPVAKAGKGGYGPSAAKHLAKQGLKKFLKKETLMGKAGCTSEETDLEESRGHKILATKLRQIDTMSSGIAPDHSTNVQSTKDKLKDGNNIGKVEIVTQKDTTVKGQDNTEDEMETKYKLNKLSHGFGNVVHKEEVESLDEISKSQLQTYKTSKEVIGSSKYGKHFTDKQSNQSAHRQTKSDDKSVSSVFSMKPKNEEVEQVEETAALDQYIKAMGYDPEHMEKNKKVMFSKTNAFKTWAQTKQEGLYDAGQKGTQDIETSMSPGATARG